MGSFTPALTLDACIHDYPLEVPDGRNCTMGVAVGTSSFYVVISLMPDWKDPLDARIRRAIHIGRAKTFDELDELMNQHQVFRCLISPQPEPHLVQEWAKRPHRGGVYQVVYTNDGMSKPLWNLDERRVTVDRTYALNAAYEEIQTGKWWLPSSAKEIDGGEFYAQLKAPTRVRDMTMGELRYRWTETGSLDLYRHAHAFDHIAASRGGFWKAMVL